MSIKVKAIFAELPTDLQGVREGTILAPGTVPPGEGQGIITGFWLEGQQQVYIVMRFHADGEQQPLGIWRTIRGAIEQQAGGEAMRDLWALLTDEQRDEVRSFFINATPGQDVTEIVDAWTDAHGFPRLSTFIKQRAEAISLEVQGEQLAAHLSHGKPGLVH